MIHDVIKTAKGKYKAYPAQAIKAADFILHIEKLKSKSGTDPWPVIEAIVDFWVDQSPTRYKSYLYQLEDTRETRLDSKFAESKGGMFRYTLDIPADIMYIIRRVYTVEELPMDREFFIRWGKKFKKMKIAEKI